MLVPLLGPLLVPLLPGTDDIMSTPGAARSTYELYVLCIKNNKMPMDELRIIQEYNSQAFSGTYYSPEKCPLFVTVDSGN
jgi:hypothetical protein